MENIRYIAKWFLSHTPMTLHIEKLFDKNRQTTDSLLNYSYTEIKSRSPAYDFIRIGRAPIQAMPIRISLPNLSTRHVSDSLRYHSRCPTRRRYGR